MFNTFVLNSVQTGLITKRQLELQAALASAVSQFRYTSVIKIAASVEYDFGDTLCCCFFSDCLAYCSCSFLVSAVAFKCLVIGRSRNQCYASDIVDDLSADVSV